MKVLRVSHLGRFMAIGMLWSFQVTGQEFTVSTIAGGAPPSTPASSISASMAAPSGIAADAEGNVLNFAANTRAARSATIATGTTAVTASQLSAGGLCTYSISPVGQVFSAAGGTGAFAVSTAAGCTWTAVSPVAWVTIIGDASGSGNGIVRYVVAPNGTSASRSSTITFAAFAFTVEQLAVTSPALVAAGSMPQVASGGGWNTTLTLVNNGVGPAEALLSFIAETGSELTLPLTFPQTGAGPTLASTLQRTINAGATLIIHSEGPVTQNVQQGWAQLLTNGAITGFAVFRQRVGESEQEAVVPLETRAAPGYLLAFDNTSGVETGVAVANLAPQGAAVSVIINDDTGAHIQTSPLNLGERGHTAFVLSSLYPATGRKRGTIEFRPPAGGQISVLGLRFNPKGAFTTIPLMLK